MRKRPLIKQSMKRKGNLFNEIISIDNLMLADTKASKGKSKQLSVINHNKNKEVNILQIYEMLKNKTYRTSPYTMFTIYEPKERLISRLPYFPDRIVHHAIMNVLEPIFISSLTADTFSCIKNRGIHAAAEGVKKALMDKDNTLYCLKLDVRKFYPSIDHDILKMVLRRKFKDEDLLWLLDDIIDSAPGVPIGNYLSQYFANFYLSGFDHWLKEEKKVKYYFRYTDDLVILSDDKARLHELLSDIRNYLEGNLRLAIKDNYQIFPVESRGIDFVGYKFYHTHVLLRKSIKQSFARMLKKRHSEASVASYYGWASHCDTKNLMKKLLA